MNHEKMQKDWGWRIKRAGFTQKQFADILDISDMSLGQYISLKSSPNVKTFQAIEKKLEELGA